MEKFKNILITKKVLLFIGLFWILFFVMKYAWLNAIDTIGDLLLFILYFSNVILILYVVVKIIGLVFFKRMHSNRVKRTGSTALILTLLLVVHMILLYSNLDFGYSTAGLVSFVNKEYSDGSYYLYVENDNEQIELKCTKEVYESVVCHEMLGYSVAYRWLTSNRTGVLKDIDLINLVDNRRID